MTKWVVAGTRIAFRLWDPWEHNYRNTIIQIACIHVFTDNVKRWDERPYLATRSVYCYFSSCHLSTNQCRLPYRFTHLYIMYIGYIIVIFQRSILYMVVISLVWVSHRAWLTCLWSLHSCLPSSYSTKAVDCPVCLLRRRSAHDQMDCQLYHKCLHRWTNVLMYHQFQYQMWQYLEITTVWHHHYHLRVTLK